MSEKPWKLYKKRALSLSVKASTKSSNDNSDDVFVDNNTLQDDE